jgi:hypothetical protein
LRNARRFVQIDRIRVSGLSDFVNQVPIRESVGAALRFLRDNLRFVLMTAALFAAIATAITTLSIFVPQAGLLTMIASTVAQAFCYAIFIGAALFGSSAVGARWRADGWRVFASMAVVGFFLLIVMFVLTFVVSIVLAAGPIAPYVADLQAAGSDQAAVLTVMQRFLLENAATVMFVLLFFTVVWFLLTSRLYIAAPASVDAQRILSFETWKWTKGAMLRITAARFLLLAPAYMFAFAISQLLGRLVGIDPFDAASVNAAVSANPIGVLVFDFARAFILFALYAPLEAGLSTYLYRGLKPAEAPPPAA